MVCMDLIGHRFGSAALPDEVGESLFALGAECSAGTHELVSSLKRAEPGVIVRPADSGIIPPLSDYGPFWDRRIPFLFLSAGRSRVYHTPEDTPDKLDHRKLAATARWLTRFVRAARLRDAGGYLDAASIAERSTRSPRSSPRSPRCRPRPPSPRLTSSSCAPPATATATCRGSSATSSARWSACSRTASRDARTASERP